MDIALAKSKVNKLEEGSKEVGNLLLDLGFDLIECGNNTKILKAERVIGQIDLLFKDFEAKRIFLIEVSKQKGDRADKIGNFFRKWSINDNLELLINKFSLPTTYKIIRIYFDLSDQTIPNSLTLSGNKKEYFLTIEDFNYFIDAFDKVGKWAKNDFLSFLNVKEQQPILSEKDAIQFYLGDIRAYSFVDSVANLLKYCYVFRRKCNDMGYQRMLEKSKIGNISRKVRKGNILAFPNAILLSAPERAALCPNPKDRSDCPAPVKINIPNDYCSLRIIDGQHRLLSFTTLEQQYHESHFIPVVVFENIDTLKEMRTFIDINSGQKKIDRNLILTLQADFAWNPIDNSKEFVEKQTVEVIKRLNSSFPLKGKIFIPHALETKKGKLMLNTFVSAIIGNNLIGGKLHLYQNDSIDIDSPYRSIHLLFSQLKQHLPRYSTNVGDFFLSNKGLRVIFRLIQIFVRNKKASKISVEQEQFIKDLARIMDDILKNKIDRYYGEGGAMLATEEICRILKRRKAISYAHLITDLRNFN